MHYRVFWKPEAERVWLPHSEYPSLQAALAALDSIEAGHRTGQWVARDLRGETVARLTVTSLPRAGTRWSTDHVV